MGKESGDNLAKTADKLIDLAKSNPELAKNALDLVSQFASQQGESNSQVQNSQPKKPLKKGLSMQTKLMIGVGALMLMLVLGPIIFPAIAGMGAMGSALMAGAGAGLLTYGASKVAEERKTPSTGYSNRIQPSSDQMIDKVANAMFMAQQQSSKINNPGPGQDPSTNQTTKPEDFNKALEQVRESGAGEGLKPNEQIIKEVDAKRDELMTALALPANLKTMLDSNTTNMPAFEKGFDEHLKQSFFANMGEKQTGRGDAGMGREFLTKVNENDSEENKAFNEFKGNMLALLKNDQEHRQSESPQARKALIAEKDALTTAIENIEGLKAGNKVSKESLDKSAMMMVGKDKKDEVDKDRLGNLVAANEKIGKAKENFENQKSEAKSSMGTSQSAQATGQGPAPATSRS